MASAAINSSNGWTSVTAAKLIEASSVRDSRSSLAVSLAVRVTIFRVAETARPAAAINGTWSGSRLPPASAAQRNAGT